MKQESSTHFINRYHAAQQLISNLGRFKNSNCCVIAISNGAVAIASHVARRLDAELIFIPTEKIKDPADPLKSIGVVSFDYTVADSIQRDIPQDYIYQQTRRLRSELFTRYSDMYSPIDSKFHNRIVILIDDLVQTSDEILGCLRTIRAKESKEIIVAVPVITQRAAHEVIQEADSVIFIHVASEDSIKNCYMDFDTITDEEVRELMKLSIEEIVESKLSNHN